MEIKRLANYNLEIIDICEFKEYLDKNEHYFSTSAMNAYLKAVDIPPKFFKEQPEDTRRILLDNREIFVRETKKYFNKVIIVVVCEQDLGDKVDRRILGACRLDHAEAIKNYEQLEQINRISNKFEHRSFVKDGYISLIIGDDIKKDRENKVLAVDFPINLNKKPVIHKAYYILPNETFATAVEHIHYIDSTEIELGIDYNNIEEALFDFKDFLDNDDREVVEPQNILREVDVVALALQELGVIPKSYKDKIASYIETNLKGELDDVQLESRVLDFDENFKSYKQVTALRSVSGAKVIEFLNSPQFKELEEALSDIEEC